MSTIFPPNIQEILDLLEDDRTRTSRLFRDLAYRIKLEHDTDKRRKLAEEVASLCQSKYPRFGRYNFMIQCGLASAREADKDF